MHPKPNRTFSGNCASDANPPAIGVVYSIEIVPRLMKTSDIVRTHYWKSLVGMRRDARRDLRRLPSSRQWCNDRYAKRRWIKSINDELNRRFPDKVEESEEEMKS